MGASRICNFKEVAEMAECFEVFPRVTIRIAGMRVRNKSGHARDFGAPHILLI